MIFLGIYLGIVLHSWWEYLREDLLMEWPSYEDIAREQQRREGVRITAETGQVTRVLLKGEEGKVFTLNPN